jgi:hypothetical protein
MQPTNALDRSDFFSISDIQTTDILYYDPDLEKEHYKFCQERDIDCLPSLEDKRTVYLRNDETPTFKKTENSKDRIIPASMNIFNPQLLESFERNPLLLVFENEELAGVVHFSDYGKTIVSVYLYELFFMYEKALRSLLVAHGCTDEDMIAYFEHKAKDPEDKERYSRRLQKYKKNLSKKKRTPFELCYIREIRGLVKYKNIVKLKNLSYLRNMIMHAHELVRLDDPEVGDYVYDFKSFETFFKLTTDLHFYYGLVKKHPAFSETNSSS